MAPAPQQSIALLPCIARAPVLVLLIKCKMASEITVGRQLEIVLNKYKSGSSKKKKSNGVFSASAASNTSTEVVSLDERKRLADEYANLRAEVGLAPGKQSTVKS